MQPRRPSCRTAGRVIKPLAVTSLSVVLVQVLTAGRAIHQEVLTTVKQDGPAPSKSSRIWRGIWIDQQAAMRFAFASRDLSFRRDEPSRGKDTMPAAPGGRATVRQPRRRPCNLIILDDSLYFRISAACPAGKASLT